MCREGHADYIGTSLEIDMVVDEEKAILDSQASKVVENMKSALRLRFLRWLLSKNEIPPIEAAIKADVIVVLLV
ncbi:hypothetical protein KSP40_PGU015224 [Platanthera guangdongensis]|uniref:Uncharacterized protein n=1 Tax=Platanthera guangdongensis TaxID=2320717 RepID=A0ABR2M8I5_9ASPA